MDYLIIGENVVRRILKNKPLVEAIFQLHWQLLQPVPNVRIDPHYKILIGRLYDRVIKEYPFHGPLPTSMMPEEIAGYVVQYRFRKNENTWPLIQIGPGVITLNDTENYVWEDFEKRISLVLQSLFEAYPNSEENLKVNQLLLRYIDTIDFDFEKQDIFEFLRNQMKMNLSIHDKLFEDTGIDKLPLSFDLNFSFPSKEPKGVVRLRFSRAGKKGAGALKWETMVESRGEDAPKIKDNILGWVEAAHYLTDDWFFKIIEGDLEKRFE